MRKPLASMLMLTYGRLLEDHDSTSLISEAVYSFLMQDYPNKELILLNDAPGQTIRFNHPQVKVINRPQRFRTLGEKRNAAVKAAQGEYLFVFDDDDIMFPWRLTRSVEHFQQTGAGYSGLDQHLFSVANEKYSFNRAVGRGLMASACYTREAIERVPYVAMNSGEDQRLHGDMAAAGIKVDALQSTLENVAMIYRWGYLARNISSLPAESGYDSLGRKRLPVATIKLQPAWRYDYVRRLRDLVAAGLL